MNRAWCSVGLLSLAIFACNDVEEQAKLAQAKGEASAKAAAEELEASKKAEALREQRKADAKAEPARAEARATIRKTLSASDMKAMDLKERLGKAKSKVKANALAASAEYDKRRTAAERDLELLNTASGPAWDTSKAQMDKDLDALKTGLDAFEKALGH